MRDWNYRHQPAGVENAGPSSYGKPNNYLLRHTQHDLSNFRPPGTVVPGGLMFCCFFSFLWHFAALYLRDGWGDRPETFTHDWKCGHLDFGG